jgi:hypothetical protein
VDHNSTVAHSESYTPKDLGCQYFNVQHNYNGALHIAIGTLPFEACLVFLRNGLDAEKELYLPFVDRWAN